jgi:hypothetical protein
MTAILLPVQTNGALLRQLSAARYSSAELRSAAEAYVLASELFCGMYRGSGKPFVCHLVGTASVIGQIGSRIDVVLAALLHAAFDAGVFPDGRSGLSPGHVKLLATRVGPEAANLVIDYHSFKWTHEVIASIANSSQPDDRLNTLLLLRLANEIDELTDAGHALSPKHAGLITERCVNLVRIAHAIGRVDMAATIEHLLAENQTAKRWARDLRHGMPFDCCYRLHRLIPYLRARQSNNVMLIRDEIRAKPDVFALPDQKWIEVAHFLREAGRQGDVEVAPQEFRYLCDDIRGELLPEDPFKALKPDAIVLLHKGRLAHQPKAALAALLRATPIFANEVFAVFSRTGTGIPVQAQVHIEPVSAVANCSELTRVLPTPRGPKELPGRPVAG